MLDKMIDKNLNSPLSSSCGRWFDAFAAALGLHSERIDYEGQAAMALEILATPVITEEQPYQQAWSIRRCGEFSILSWKGLWRAVLTDLSGGIDKARIAARIHHSLIAATVELLLELSQRTDTNCIVLSGGVFQNRLLLEGVSEQLQQHGKTVLTPGRYPMNDGGLALGQAVIAAAQRL
jgi:hydrogenase maturation protein HypF